jgi:hypothetical protein
VAAAKIIRLRKANPCGADGDRTKWSNVAFVIVLSSIAGGVLGISSIYQNLIHSIKNYLDDVLVADLKRTNGRTPDGSEDYYCA